MHRRRYLTLAAMGLAGCTSGDESATETTTAPPTSTPTRTPTKSPTTTTEAETTTPTETETETETPNVDPAAAAAIETARDELTEALNEFASYANGDATTIVDVAVSVDDFPDTVAAAPLRRARESLDEAASTAADVQEPTIADLREIADFLETAVTAQYRLVEAYAHLSEGVEYIAQFGENRLSSAMADRDAAQFAIEDLNNMDSSVVRSLPALQENTVEAKVEQLTTVYDRIPDFRPWFEDFGRAQRELESAEQAYERENYNTAQTEAASAARRFDRLSSETGDTELPASLANLTTTISTKADSRRREARELEQQAARSADQ